MQWENIIQDFTKHPKQKDLEAKKKKKKLRQIEKKVKTSCMLLYKYEI